MDKIIEIKDLAVVRDGRTLLHVPHWQIEKGQHWAMVGANGCGKTTLLNVMMGYMAATSGEVTVLNNTFGKCDWRNVRPLVGMVGTSIQQRIAENETGLAIVLSGKNARINLWGELTNEDIAAAERILADVECSHLRDQAWRKCSQGEKQRLLIGRAWMTNPVIMILDEPCTGLDPVAREHFLTFLQRLTESENYPTLVLVTHHIEEIMPCFSHVLALGNGKVIAQDLKENVLHSDALSQVFGTKMHIEAHGNRYWLRVLDESKGLV
jgi:iron complex transport system ATP-binding protein